MTAPGTWAAGIGVEVCWGCGCTDKKACRGGCSWFAPGICTRCAEKQGLAVKYARPLAASRGG